MTKFWQIIQKWYEGLGTLFTAKEAWGLYIPTAYAETISWCGLLLGIGSKVMKWPISEWLLPILGSIHGLIFIWYIFIIFFTHRSMKWSFCQMVWAEALCNVPFGALVFERYITRKLH